MKFKLNLQFELLLIVSLVVAMALSIFYYLTINNQKNIFHDSFQDSAINLAHALDASIGSKNELDDIAKLQSNIYKMIWLSSSIVGISISLPIEDGLRVVASNDTNVIGEMAIPESLIAYRDGTISAAIVTEADGTGALRVITPVHVGGQRVGVYSIKLSLDPLKKVIDSTQREFLLITLISILAIIGVLSFSIKITVIDPIKQLLNGMEKIGGGELDYRVKTKRQDEIGNLFSSLNVMAEKLKDRTEALQKERGGLAEKVAQKTKELQEKINDLEKFNKIVIGREIKMVELKREIDKLKQQASQAKDNIKDV